LTPSSWCDSFMPNVPTTCIYSYDRYDVLATSYNDRVLFLRPAWLGSGVTRLPVPGET